MKVRIESTNALYKGVSHSLQDTSVSGICAKQNHWLGISVTKWFTEECNEDTAVFDTRKSGEEVVDTLNSYIERRILTGEAVRIVLTKKIRNKEREIVLAKVSLENVARLKELYEIHKAKARELEDFDHPVYGSEAAKTKSLMYDMYVAACNLKRLEKNGLGDPAFAAAQEAAETKHKEWENQRDVVRKGLERQISDATVAMERLGFSIGITFRQLD
jgi:DNA primase large subunit